MKTEMSRYWPIYSCFLHVNHNIRTRQNPVLLRVVVCHLLRAYYIMQNTVNLLCVMLELYTKTTPEILKKERVIAHTATGLF